MISHTKKFGIYHWDTFDNETLLIDEADTLAQAQKKKSPGSTRTESLDKGQTEWIL
jgi:hypothetical protein